MSNKILWVGIIILIISSTFGYILNYHLENLSENADYLLNSEYISIDTKLEITEITIDAIERNKNEMIFVRNLQIMTLGFFIIGICILFVGGIYPTKNQDECIKKSEGIDYIRCISCNREIPNDSKFCPYCNKNLEIKSNKKEYSGAFNNLIKIQCPKCEKIFQIDDNLVSICCINCGFEGKIEEKINEEKTNSNN